MGVRTYVPTRKVRAWRKAQRGALADIIRAEVDAPVGDDAEGLTARIVAALEAVRPEAIEPMDVDHAAWLIRKAEDEAREAAKAAGAAAFAARVAAGEDVGDSADPTTGLQPAIGSHDAWEAEARAMGRTPHCTGCGAPLDPTYCDPEARARAADYDAAQKAAVVGDVDPTEPQGPDWPRIDPSNGHAHGRSLVLCYEVH